MEINLLSSELVLSVSHAGHLRGVTDKDQPIFSEDEAVFDFSHFASLLKAGIRTACL